MKKFSWEHFKQGKFLVCCKTNEEEMDFLTQCEKQGILWGSGDKPTTHTYLKNSFDSNIIYFNMFFGSLGCSTASKIDINKMKQSICWATQPKTKFTWREVFANIKEGEVYTLYNKFIKMSDGRLVFGDDTGCMSFSLDTEFTKKEQPKPVDFTTAFKAIKQGKIIQSMFTEYYYKLGVNSILLEGESRTTITQCGTFEFEEIEDDWLIIE